MSTSATPTPAIIAHHLRDESLQSVDGEAGGHSRGQSPGTGQSSATVRMPSASSQDVAPGTNNLTQTASSLSKKIPSKLSRKETAGKDAKDAKSGSASNRAASPATPADTAIDPLSHLIFVRTNTDRTIASRLRSSGKPDSPANEGLPGLPRPSSDLSTKPNTQQPEPGKEKKKGASFLSRFSMIANKKKDDDANDNDSEISDMRTEGANAVAFSSNIGAAGYIPHHKEPPRYIRVRSHNKKKKEFNRIFLAQEMVGTYPPVHDNASTGNKAINGAPVKPVHGFGHKNINTGGPIWAVEFSRDGKYLASAGRDRVVRIWAVMSTPEDRTAYQEEEKEACNGARLSAPVFHPKPVREFTGHTGEVLDLSWSKNNFLLSSSMDKTVRLWHMSRQECLCIFKHKDFVTSIAFHPGDDRFFLAGSLDSTLRLWSIPDKAVAYSSQLPDLITAVAFSPDGKAAIAGCLNGLCTFYETEGFKYQTQIYVRSSRGKNAKGSKITGIQTMAIPPKTGRVVANSNDSDESVENVKVLISSNDSRIRIYNLKTKELEVKFKGHENTCNQIRGSFSDGGQYVICGSEDRKAFIWPTGSAPTLAERDRLDKRPYEYFEAHPDVVTQAIFAPTASRQLLQASEDPLFTLCNPPPVTLLSKEEAMVSQTTLPSQDQGEPAIKLNKPEHSPSFIERSIHADGNIIVTTDHAGIIKVFRQDCAYAKRRHETWETGSTFSKKLGRDSFLGRTGSIVTRTSTSSFRDPHSRRGSLVGSHPASLLGTPQMNSDRINTWRHGIEGNHQHGYANGGSRPTSMTMMTPPTRSERSVSPAKARTRAGSNLASEQRRQLYANVTRSPSIGPMSPTSSISKEMVRSRLKKEDEEKEMPMQPPTPSFSYCGAAHDEAGDDDVLRLDPAGPSYNFWNLNRWRGLGVGKASQDKERCHQKKNSDAIKGSSLAKEEAVNEMDMARRRSLGNVLSSGQSGLEQAETERKSTNENGQVAPPEGSRIGRPPERQDSVLSKMMMEMSSDDFNEHDGSGQSQDEEMQCFQCSGRSFKAKKVGGKQRFLCGRCGTMVDS